MNNVGLTELFLIFIVVLLIMGPERMLQMAAQMGHWYGLLQRQWRNARIMLQSEIDQVTRSADLPKQDISADDNKVIRPVDSDRDGTDS